MTTNVDSNYQGHNHGFCLVLSGGGAKGAYHLGVWKALQELKVPVSGIVGSSIGAALGAAFAMGDPAVWEAAGNMFSLDHVLNVPDSFVKEGRLKVASSDFKDIMEALQMLKRKHGLDTTPFQEMINTWISEEALRTSGIDFGINTIDISSRKPKELFLEQMPAGSVNSYILASAAFPGFERPKIDGHAYIDGGVYDSIPYQMARKRGYTRIIVSDISGVGIKHKLNIAGTQTVYIKNSSSIGGLLDFDPETIEKLKLYGYLDTLKCFGQAEGVSCCIRTEEGVHEAYERLKGTKGYNALLDRVLADLHIEAGSTVQESLAQLKLDDSKHDLREYMLFCDYAAVILGIDTDRIYTYGELESVLNERQQAEEGRLREYLATGDETRDLETLNSVKRIVKFGLDASLLKETPYFLYLLVGELLQNRGRKGAVNALARKYPELPGGLFGLGLLKLAD